jgi:Flp pilus assembly protein TadD
MNYLSLAILLTVFSCASKKTTDDRPMDKSATITKQAFKKEKVLTSSEVQDYYPIAQKLQNPALQDETIDRYTVEEIAKLAEGGDPLFELSLRCSKKDYDQAFAHASKIFNRYQKIPAYWNLVGNCHLSLGSPRKALLFYNKALEVSPNYVPALNNIGVLYSRQGEDQKALVAFEKANKQSPFSKTPRYNLARLYLAYGMADAALPYFQGLLNESPQDVDLLNAVANCHFMLSDYQKALSLFSRIPAQLYRRAELGLNYALTLKKVGRQGDAQKAFNDIETPKSKELKDYHQSIANQLGIQL